MNSPNIPAWLSASDSYTPPPDRDSFINRSILSLLNILSKIRLYSGHREKKFEVNAVLKVTFTLAITVLLSLSGNFIFVVTVNIYLLFLLGLMRGDEIIRILKISLIVAAFTIVILLPVALFGNRYSAVMVTPKVFATVMAVNILSHSTPWNLITGSMKRFFVPDIFILVLDITIKYIVLLGEFSLSMLYSLRLRSVGRNIRKSDSLSGVAGTMFIKSTEMAEEVYSAMECRGFTGEYGTFRTIRLTAADAIYTAVNICIVFIFFYFRTVHL